jgi:macrodomain Ter protein organizer (MatP/YcbG family)
MIDGHVGYSDNIADTSGVELDLNKEADRIIEKALGNDPVNNLKHYTNHPSGVECIQITEHMGFNLGNAVKYIWRCDQKLDAIEDLKKARFYIDREIAKRTK